MLKIPFSKVTANGNHFILIEDRFFSYIDNIPEFVRSICARHTGIGGDGVIRLKAPESKDAHLSILIYNADGTTPEMCVNAVFCTATYVQHQQPYAAKRLVVDFNAIRLAVETIEPDTSRHKVAFKGISLAPHPFVTLPKHLPTPPLPYKIELPQHDVSGYFVSVGNPHLVIFDQNIFQKAIQTIGPYIEKHAMFPGGINVEWVEVQDRHHIKLRIWERGVGETDACGSGTIAAGYISSLLGYTENTITATFKGGASAIDILPDNTVTLSHSAAIVFTGNYYPTRC